MGLKFLKEQHMKAASCTADLSKLSIALIDSEYEVGQFFLTDEWQNTMDDVGNLPDFEWKANFEEILDVYYNSVQLALKEKAIDVEELNELATKPNSMVDVDTNVVVSNTTAVNDSTSVLENLPKTIIRSKKGGADISMIHTVTGITAVALNSINDCTGETLGKKPVKMAMCVIKQNVLYNLLTALGLNNNPEVVGATMGYTQMAMDIYDMKTVLNMKGNIKEIVEEAIKNMQEQAGETAQVSHYSKKIKNCKRALKK